MVAMKQRKFSSLVDAADRAALTNSYSDCAADTGRPPRGRQYFAKSKTPATTKGALRRGGKMHKSTITAALAATLLLTFVRSEEHTSELQSPVHLVCRLLLEKKKYTANQ